MAEVTNDEANDLADEILRREEFLPAREPGFVSRAVNRVIEAIGDFFDWLLGSIFGGSGGAAGSVLAIVLLVLAAAVLLFAIYKAITTRTPKDKGEVDSGARVVFDEVVEPEQLRAELSRHTAASNWRAAVIAGFRLSVVGLIDANIAREIAGATTGDFARAVETRRPALLEPYRGASSAFERAFYSDLDIERSDLDAVNLLLSSLASQPTSKAGAR